MDIINNGLYKINNLSEDIIIFDDLGVDLFLDIENPNNEIKISVGRNVTLHFYSYIRGDGIFGIEFLGNREGSNISLNNLNFSKEEDKLNFKIISNITSNRVKVDNKILTIVGESGDIKIDGAIKVGKNLGEIGADLKSKNLFLGNKGKITGIPTLYIESDDVKASHSCNIERVDEDKLFYLKSRGIEENDAVFMLLSGMIDEIFEGYEGKEDLKENILSTIF